MHPWHDSYIDDSLIATAFPVVIEIPKGSTNKYELDKDTGLLRLDRVLYSAVLLQGRFCHACGQKAAASDVSLHELLHEGLEEFAHVDGKAARTLKLLVTKPGALTKEFLEGRRARYISPLRLYLTCSLLFFALSALA